MAGAMLSLGVLACAATLVVGGCGVGAAATAALAAADTASGAAAGVPCGRAAEIAATMGATLTRCDLDELVATVTVSAVFARVSASASARAGPAPG
jgi:hypothetical protein